ncbi:MAG: hypothetical protein JXA28_04820 [Bacteroidetes bacterium]|nr:hypothetical protein [Bacteroidota bacterium]
MSVTVHDLLGRRVAILADETQGPGMYTLRTDGLTVPNGAYICRIDAAGVTESRILVLMR